MAAFPTSATRTCGIRTAAALVALGVVTAGAACKKDPPDESVVKVTVRKDADVGAPIAKIAVTLSNGGTSDQLTFTPKSGSTIEFPTTFGIALARARSGNLDLALEALAANEAVAAHGEVRAKINNLGGLAEVEVTLHAGASSCGNGQMDPGESCDDGNRVSGDGCDFDCGLGEVAEPAPEPPAEAPPEPAPDGGAPDKGDAGGDAGPDMMPPPGGCKPFGAPGEPDGCDAGSNCYLQIMSYPMCETTGTSPALGDCTKSSDCVPKHFCEPNDKKCYQICPNIDFDKMGICGPGKLCCRHSAVPPEMGICYPATGSCPSL